MGNRFEQCEGFEWDQGNIGKNWIKHQVGDDECEQIFFNNPLFVRKDEVHSKDEDRWYALGVTNAGRFLFVSFTLRDHWIRVISARGMNRKEIRIYHEEIKKDSQI